jgi:hypothetical protein
MTNQSIAEHDLAHMAGFISSEKFAIEIINAFRIILVKMNTNPKLYQSLHNFNSVYSTRLYYTIEVFTIISDKKGCRNLLILI